MTSQAESATGSIYDLGYRLYEGERLGRRYAFLALYLYSFRGVFGIGRSAVNKFFPIGLALIALTPAIAQLSIAAFAPQDITVVEPQDFFGYIGIVVALFCAVASPELIGRDHRNRTLSLYFSRALSRMDYVSSKVAALFVALFLVVSVPQLILFLGNAVSTEAVLTYIGDHIDWLPPIFASSLVTAITMTSLSLAIASYTPKRALATGVVVAYFVIFTSLGRTLMATVSGDLESHVILISPLDILEGIVFWSFGATPTEETPIHMASVEGPVYLAAACVYTVVSLAILYRRIHKLVV